MFFRTFISNFASKSKQIVNFRGQKVPYFIEQIFMKNIMRVVVAGSLIAIGVNIVMMVA